VFDLEELDDLLDRFAACGFLAPGTGSCRATSRKLACMRKLRPAMMLSSTDMPLNKAMF